jgi:hypothetical protein
MSKDSETENEMLAREWMASEHWGGWRGGIKCWLTGRICIDALTAGAPVWHRDERKADGSGGGLPDVSHPGTRAFLLEDVRRAWGIESYVDTFALHKRASCIRVLAPNRPNFKTMDHETEQAALIAALRAAPEKTK